MNIVTIKTVTDEKLGSLSFFEGTKDIPFDIKRIYYTYNVPNGSRRGGHAHKDLSQLLFCPFGQIRIILDDGIKKEEILLNSPSIGLIIENGVWRDMVWEREGAVLCVAASGYYDEKDYIRNYDEFIKLVQEGFWIKQK